MYVISACLRRFVRSLPPTSARTALSWTRGTSHAEHAGALSSVAAREYGMAFQQQREDHAGDTSRCAALLCTTLRPPHARLGMGLRTRSMLGPSSVARLRRSHAEFRQNRRETDATKLQKMLSEASTAAMWKPAAQRLRPTRPPARPASAGSHSGRPPASVCLGQPRPIC